MKMATFDIETNGLLDATQVWCIAIKDHQDGNVSTFSDFADSGGTLRDGLNTLGGYDVIIGHNIIGFDLPVLRRLKGWSPRDDQKIVDTVIVSRTQRPNRAAVPGSRSGPHSVEAWAIRLGREKFANDVWDVFHPGILERCRTDVETQYLIYEALVSEGKGEGWGPAHKLNTQLFKYLQQQEERGWYIDKERLAKHVYTLERWITRIDNAVIPRLPLVVDRGEKELSDGSYTYVAKPFNKNGSLGANAARYMGDDSIHVGGPYSRISVRVLDIASNTELKEFLLLAGWEPSEWNWKEDENGKSIRTSPKLSKTDKFVGVRGGLGKLIVKRVQCQHRLSNLQGYAELIRSDGRIGAAVGGIATTGRLKHAGIVNVPSPGSKAFFAHQMREIFAATPGWIMVGVDSKGNQVRQLAARMGDEDFTKAVLFGDSKDGTDIHSVNQRASGAPSRNKAKNFFYGFIFGAGPGEIARQVGISYDAAKALIARYLDSLPKLKELIEYLTKQWMATAKRRWNAKFKRWEYHDGYIIGLDGRRVYCESPHAVLCYALQSDEAIQMAAAYCRIHQQAKKAGLTYGEDWGMLIWMHDEYQMEARNPELAKVLGQIACDAIKWAGEFFNIKCPHDGEAKLGHNWAETH